jgi:hypothetical protein
MRGLTIFTFDYGKRSPTQLGAKSLRLFNEAGF